ncbi:hypothetical protein BLAT2472_11253 [Burkholderia latens]
MRVGARTAGARGIARTLGERSRCEHADDIEAVQAGTGREFLAMAAAGAARACDPAVEPGSSAVAYRPRVGLPEPERVFGDVPARIRRKPARVHAARLRTPQRGKPRRGRRNGRRRRDRRHPLTTAAADAALSRPALRPDAPCDESIRAARASAP